MHLHLENMYEKEFVSKCARVLELIDYRRDVDCEMVGRHLTRSFSNRLQTIERLDLASIYVGFSNIVTLVRLLPSLRELKVCGISETRLLQEMTVSQIVNKYSSPNPKFAALNVIAVYPETFIEVTPCVAILVILCPGLRRIVAGKYRFKDSWADVAEMQKYQGYRERLGQVKLL